MNEVIHDSDCGLHNEPAFPNTTCDCSARDTPPDAAARIAELEETLKWYGDVSQYEIDEYGITDIERDDGKRARAALEQK